MVSVSELKALCASLKANDTRIGEIVMVANEGHLINKLDQKPGVILACIYPSADRAGEQNESIDVNATWLFVLEKDIDGQSNSDEEAQFEKLQQVALKSLTYIEDIAVSTCGFLSRHQPSGTKINPEWREFGGFNGWSMSLVF